MLPAIQQQQRIKTYKWCALGVGSLFFLILAVQLFSLQIAGWEYYQVQSEANRIRAVPLPGIRGLILDRNGELLVDNGPSYIVSIIPGGLKRQHTDAAMDRLTQIIEIDQQLVRQRIRARRGYSYQPVKLKRDVSIQTISTLEENCLEFPGIIYQTEIRRTYPFRELACHILGYVGEISEAEFHHLESQGYLWGDLIGTEGIERQYEAVLRGERGVKYVETNAMGREIRGFPKRTIEPRSGGSVVLTIDRHLQEVAENAFPDSMAGSLVALDPRNGEILVMMSKPGFDPSVFSGVLSESDWDKLNRDPMHPLLNRSIQGMYAPGSTFKMSSAIVALHTGLIDEHSVFEPCMGSLFFGDRYFGCWSAHGRLNVTGAIIESCDVFFYHLAQRMDLNVWNDYAQLFGFGQPTGIDLECEAMGLIPSTSYYNQRYGKHGWAKGAVLNLSIGQGELLVTPVQVARYIGAIATGKICAPHLVQTIQGREYVRPSFACEDISIPSHILQVIRAAMVGVLEDPKGTGRASRIPGVHFAGKTGTAQNPHGEDHAWFVAFAPAEHPTIAIAAIVENGGHGSSVAAPIVRKVIEAYLHPSIANSRKAIQTRG